MRIHLIAVGMRLDKWVNDGFQEYNKRLPRDSQINLIEIPVEKRRKNADISRLIEKEGDKMIAAIPASSKVIALEIQGLNWHTEQLSGQLSQWQQGGNDIALLVGGPEGLAPQCQARAELSWSLSSLTLPHPLVRIIIAEQLYRAWSLLNNHPYHR